MPRRPRFAGALALLALLRTGLAPADSPRAMPDLSGYKTVETAATPAASKPSGPASSEAPPAYLGILLDPDAKADPVIADVDPDSPASRAGVKPGDILRKVDGKAIKDGDAMVEVLGEKSAGEPIALELSRQDKPVSLRAILTPWSRTMSAQDRLRSGLGIQVAASRDGGEGLTIERIAPGSPADRAKLKVGEVLLKLDDVALTGPDQLYDLVDARPSEATVVTTLRLAEKAVDMKIKLDPAPAIADAGPGPTVRVGPAAAAGSEGRWRPTTG